MSIGEVLSDARRQAGLSTAEVSRRTKIRESIIRDIERNEYSSSGGDFYARGHIRSIARVIGTDSRPLIEEYDAARAPDESLDEVTGRVAATGAADSGEPDVPGEPDGPAAPGDRGGGAAPAGPEILGRPTGSGGPSPTGPEILGDRAIRRSAPVRPGPEILGEPAIPSPPVPDDPVVPGGLPVPGDPAAFDDPWAPGPPPASGPAWLSGTRPDFGIPPDPGTPQHFSAPPDFDTPPDFDIPPYPGALPDLDPPPVSSAPSFTGPPAGRGDPAAAGGRAGHRGPVVPGGPAVSVGSEVTGPPEAAGTGWLSAPVGADQAEPPTERMRIEPSEEARIPGLTGPPRRARVAGWSVEPPSRRPDQHRRAVVAGIGLAILVTIGIIAYLLMAGLQHASGRPVAASTGRAHAHSRHGSHPTAPATPQVSHTPTVPPSSPPPPATQALTPVSAAAFGPGGRPGDDPQGAAAAIDHNPASRWHTDWYTTAYFGNLYPGTGLLLDLGRPVTVTSARITLGSTQGASFQVRVGNVTDLAGLRSVAAASHAGGVVHLQAARPAPGRYVLIWFTKLPPDNAGTFEVSVYDVSLQGHP